MFRYLVLLPLIAFTISACVTSKSGEAPSPVISVSLTGSPAGLAALSDGPLDPKTCEGVLARPPSTHTLNLQALTGSGQAGLRPFGSMCSAVYETPSPSDPFLAIALMHLDSDATAIERYEFYKQVFVTGKYLTSEVNSADDAQLDQFSAVLDAENIGRTVALRHNSWFLTITDGPNTADSLWTTDDLRLIGESIIARAQE